MLVHCSPKILDLAVDLEEDLVQMPLISRLWATAFELVSVDLPELEASVANGFIADDDPTSGEEFFYITVAERKAKIEPDSVGDNSGGVAVALVECEVSRGKHATIIHVTIIL
jgi:hypothetical protein